MVNVVDVADHLQRFNRDGYTILEGVIEDDLVDGLIETIVRLEHELGIGPTFEKPYSPDSFRGYFEGEHTHKVRNLLARDPIFARTPVHAAVLPLVEEILDPQCLVQTVISLVVGPGARGQVIHADDMYLPVPRPHLPLGVNALWALSDFTEANGATRIVPGTHTLAYAPAQSMADLPDLHNEDAYDTIPALMPRGSVLLTHSSVYHGAGANHTDERRFGMAVTYAPGWIRQQDNLQLGIPMETIRTFEPRLQQLIGLRGLYGGFIGNINYQDPAAVLLDV